MASLGHIAVGMAAARVYDDGRVPGWPALAFWSGLSLLPDADVIGFALGVEYADPWGHRGATHSLLFSIAVGAAIGLAARWFKRPGARTALVASVVLASHAILDTMTDGGLGCALWWPFDLTRYFAPWQPIRVAPIGVDFFTPGGAVVALIELALFSPVFVFALHRRRAEISRVAIGTFLAVWLAAVWLIVSGDPIREAVIGFLLREDTAYASGFSERAFRTVTRGTSQEEVRRRLGAPLRERWFYPPKGETLASAATRSASAMTEECLTVSFESGTVVTALDADACRKVGIERGLSRADVNRVLGSPPESCWAYTWSPRNARYRRRVLCFSNARVDSVIRRWE